MKIAFKRDDAIALRLADRAEIFADDLDRTFPCLDAGILEKYRIGKRILDEALGECLAHMRVEDVRCDPEFFCLFVQRAYNRGCA